MDDIERHPYRALFSPLSRADSDVRWMLVTIAVVDLVGMLLVAWVGHGGLYVLIGTWLLGVVLTLVIAVRLPRYTAGGLMWFLVPFLIFEAITWLVAWVGIWTGWFANQPAYHYAIAEAVGAIPLLVGIVVVSRRLRTLGPS